MSQYLESNDVEEVKAFVARRTDNQQIIDNVLNFAVAITQGAIANDHAEGRGLPNPDDVKVVHRFVSGNYTDLKRAGEQTIPGLKYMVNVTMPSGITYDGYCFLTQGGGGKLIDFLLEDEVRDWWPDSV